MTRAEQTIKSLQYMKDNTKMIPKGLLTDWQRLANDDLYGVSIRSISKGTGFSEPTILKYLKLRGKNFHVHIIDAINEYRRQLKEEAKRLAV